MRFARDGFFTIAASVLLMAFAALFSFDICGLVRRIAAQRMERWRTTP